MASASTVTVVPGLHADFDAAGKLIDLEVLDASEILDGKLQFKMASLLRRNALYRAAILGCRS